MSSLEISSSHIKNLGHKIQEIRERALENLISKLKYGFQFDNKLARSQETLQYLFKWFDFEICEKQHEVLDLMLYILKSPTGQTIMHHVGSQYLTHRFETIKSRITIENAGIFDDIMILLKREKQFEDKFSDDHIPPLNMPSSASNSSSDVYNGDLSNDTFGILNHEHIGKYENIGHDPKISIKPRDIIVGSKSLTGSRDVFPNGLDSCTVSPSLDNRENTDDLGIITNTNTEGIKIFLLPWIYLWPSDARSLTLVAEALFIKCSVQRCCRFLIDVLSKDFPAEVFLNRPSIVKSLLLLLGEKQYSSDSMEVVMVLVNSIKNRIKKLCDISLVHSKFKNSYLNHSSNSSHLNYDERKMCEHFLGSDDQFSFPEDPDERVLMLNQLPVPHFCLDFLTALLEHLGLGPATFHDGNSDGLFLSDLNVAVSLCLNITSLLIEAVTSDIWKSRSENKISQQIIEKSIEAMRTCGETINRLSVSMDMYDIKEPLFRIAYCRLITVGLKLGLWCDKSALMSPSLIVALQKSLLDASFAVLHQDTYEKITHFLAEIDNNNTIDGQYMKMYTETLSVCRSMTDTTTLLRMPSSKITKEVIPKLLLSVDSIEFHNNRKLIICILDILTQKLPTWKINKDEVCNLEKVILSLLSHSLDWVQELTYYEISRIVSNIFNVSNQNLLKVYSETSLVFLLHESVLTEICCHGLISHLDKVRRAANEIMAHFLRGKLLLSDTTWRLFIQSLTPVMPILHAYATHDDVLGNTIVKSLDLKIGQYMLIPYVEIVAGNIRMLFVKCYSANMEAANNIMLLLQDQTETDNLLPKLNSVRPDILVTAVKNSENPKLSMSKNEDQVFYQESTLFQLMEILNKDYISQQLYESSLASKSTGGAVDASFRRSALSQLSVMLQQPSLHEPFLTKGGCELIHKLLRLSLNATDTTLFPECSKICITIINTICLRSVSVRNWISKDGNLMLYILRAVFIFYGDNEFLVMAAQLLLLISYGSFIINNIVVNDDGNTINTIALPYCLTLKLTIPFACSHYWKTSTNRVPLKSDLLCKSESIKAFLRINWNISWYGDVNSITRWPYVPALTETDDFSPSLKMTAGDLITMKVTCPIQGSIHSLYRVQNSTTHAGVEHAVDSLLGYLLLIRDLEYSNSADYMMLPWRDTFSRFLTAPPANPHDAALLISVLKFLNIFILYIDMKDINENSGVAWIPKIIFNTNSVLMNLLSKPNLYSFEYDDEIDGTILKQQTLKLLVNSSNYHTKLLTGGNCLINDQIKNDNVWNDIVITLTECLNALNLCNFHTLGYLGDVIKCILDILMIPECTIPEDTTLSLIDKMCEIMYVSHQHQKYNGYKGLALMESSFAVLCCAIDQMIRCDLSFQTWYSTWFIEERMGIFKISLRCFSSESVTLRAVILQFLSGLASIKSIIVYLDEALSEIRGQSLGMALSCFLDLKEASIVRVQAAHFLVNLVNGSCGSSKQNADENLYELMESMNFETNILAILNKVCCETNVLLVPDCNISGEALLMKEEIEVSIAKQKEFNPSLKIYHNHSFGIDAPMVTAIADVIYVLASLNPSRINFKDNYFETYRIIFRCLANNTELKKEYLEMNTSICRMLSQVVVSSQAATDALLDTVDCISVLLRLFFPVDLLENKLQEHLYDEMLCHAYIFLGNLLSLKKGYYVIWKVIYEDATLCFFETLLIGVRSANTEIQGAATYCITQLLACSIRYNNLFDNSMSIQTYIDVTSAPISYQSRSWNQDDILSMVHNGIRSVESNKTKTKTSRKLNHRISKLSSVMTSNSESSKNVSIESIAEKCSISEEFCWVFIELFKILCLTGDLKSRMVDKNFEPITTTLCVVLASSHKARVVAVEKKFLAIILKSLIELHNFLSLDCNPHEILKEIKNSPITSYLNRLLQLIANIIMDCKVAKENCAEEGLICILGKIWPYCLTTEDLRITTVHLIQTFTNDFLGGCQTMHVSSGMRCLLVEVIELLHREIMLVSSKRKSIVLCTCLKIIENCCCDGHCRNVILKSDIVSSINKLHPAITKKRRHWVRLHAAWEKFLEVLSRYPNGQEKIMEFSEVLCALISQENGLMLSTLTNCAFNPMNRTRFMQSAEILCLFSTILSSNKPIDDKVTVCIALWALAANNHKSKLILKNAGVATKLQDCLIKLKIATKEDTSTERAIKVMDYVSKILNNRS